MTWLSQVDDWLVARLGAAAAAWVEDALLILFGLVAARVILWA